MLLLVGGVLAASIIAALGAARTGLPVLSAFLALGMLLGSDGPGGIDFDDAELAREVYGADDPLAPARGNGPFRLTRHGSGAVLRLALPFVSRSEVDLARNGDELVVTVGSYRRLLTLPSGMARHRVAGARVDRAWRIPPRSVVLR